MSLVFCAKKVLTEGCGFAASVSKLVVALCLLIASVGCGRNKLIDRVDLGIADNLESIRVSLVFSRSIEANLATQFSLKNYGYAFVNPFTDSEPLEFGFFLRTDIVNDQDYVRLTPTRVLPNGVPIGIDRTLVEVRSPSPISDKADLYAYVDVQKGEWLGAAAIFNFINADYFPDGTTASESFYRDANEVPRVQASVFGPRLDDQGNLAQAGGIALFANVKALIGQLQAAPGQKLSFYPKGELELHGLRALEYQGNRKKQMHIQNRLIQGFNQNYAFH